VTGSPRTAGLALLGLLALVVVPAASAGVAQETELAQRYAPVVRLVAGTGDCGPAEPYRPIDVNVLFGEPTVALRGPWGGGDLVKIGPAAQDLERLYQYHLDFPGMALHPACDYLHWQSRLIGRHGRHAVRRADHRLRLIRREDAPRARGGAQPAELPAEIEGAWSG
jgi:hypothetical protein